MMQLVKSNADFIEFSANIYINAELIEIMFRLRVKLIEMLLISI